MLIAYPMGCQIEYVWVLRVSLVVEGKGEMIA